MEDCMNKKIKIADITATTIGLIGAAFIVLNMLTVDMTFDKFCTRSWEINNFGKIGLVLCAVYAISNIIIGIIANKNK